MGLRLPFKLSEFTRVAWVSNNARDVWEPRIHRISNVWHEMERLAVVAGVKPAALQAVDPSELPKLSRWALNNGLVCLPLSMQGVGNNYSAGTVGYEKDKKFQFRVVIANESLSRIFTEIWEVGEDEAIGAALGFPKCCREFFQKYWKEERWNDTTLPMVGEVTSHDEAVRVGGYAECNILLRWLGLRLVSHLPCSFYCDLTQSLGEQMGLLGVRKGFVSEMDWLTQILNWPMSWDSLHGVAIITTPAFKLVVDSTPLRSRVLIERDGPIYPEEGARGNSFPFKNIHRLQLRRKDEHTDNGFKTRESMDTAHETVLKAVASAAQEPCTSFRVLDLGCGNGTLLGKIAHQHTWAIPCGVDSDPGKVARAGHRFRETRSEVRLGSISDYDLWQGPYAIGIVSANRFKELDSQEARELATFLRDRCNRVIIYSYESNKWGSELDWVFEYLQIGSFHHDGSMFAVVGKSRRDNESDPVQR